MVDHPDFTVRVAESDDASFLDAVITDGVPMWKVGRSVTLIAVYRMKQLFEQYSTRDDATRATNYSSWTDWLTSRDWPVSMGTLRSRVLDITNYRRNGASWETVQGILASAPTAGHEIFEAIAGRDGRLLPHINEEDLPGGSLQGMMEAIAQSPTPGQGRTLVREVSGGPRVYATRMVHVGNVTYMNVTYEQPETTTELYLTLRAKDGLGENMSIPPPVAEWLADQVGTQLEMLER
jgi:hypothetical protein